MKSNPAMLFGQRIREMRENHGLSQEAFADKVGLMRLIIRARTSASGAAKLDSNVLRDSSCGSIQRGGGG
jgi:transcriptional regulator with XRE-family HTH domain